MRIASSPIRTGCATIFARSILVFAGKMSPHGSDSMHGARQAGTLSIASLSPDISHYLCTIDRFCERFSGVSTVAPPRGVWRRESCWDFSRVVGCGGQRRRGLGGPLDDAAFVARCGAACQAGEPRALAAAARRTAAQPQARAAGQPDAIAILMRRTLMRTSAPILSSLRRMVPQLASVKGV